MMIKRIAAWFQRRFGEKIVSSKDDEIAMRLSLAFDGTGGISDSQKNTAKWQHYQQIRSALQEESAAVHCDVTAQVLAAIKLQKQESRFLVKPLSWSSAVLAMGLVAVAVVLWQQNDTETLEMFADDDMYLETMMDYFVAHTEGSTDNEAVWIGFGS